MKEKEGTEYKIQWSAKKHPQIVGNPTGGIDHTDKAMLDDIMDKGRF